MGIRVFAAKPDAPIPRETVWEFRCDGDHGFLTPEPGRFADYAAAMRAGWKEWGGLSGEQRLFLGPCCSGKAAR